LRFLRVRRYAAIDGDRDGRIARREYMAFGRRLFARLDGNGDAKLTLSEVRGRRARLAPSAKRRQAGGLFGQIDNDGDGTISLGELLAARRIVFRRLDADRNGAISAAEFAAREAAIVTPSGQAPPPLSAVPARASRRFLQLDRDHDGRVTVGEYLADGKARFAAADRNRNGRLDPAEFAGGAGN
jgi:Ca2+-binding EF-hand superfamily protein